MIRNLPFSNRKRKITGFFFIVVVVLLTAKATPAATLFLPAVNYSTGMGTSPASIASCDINGDHIPDMVTANNSDGSVSILLGNVDGTFQAAKNYPLDPLGTDIKPDSIVCGDFNGDGKMDLATANSNNNNISVLIGNGDGTFRAAVSYDTGPETSPISITVGDFNKDGKVDLATANIYASEVSILLGNGDGTFQAEMSYSVDPGINPYSITAGDFNGDEKIDIATANVGSNDVSVLLGRGDGTFQTAVTCGTGDGLITGISPLSIITADVNGDGKPDIATANYGSNDISVFLGKGDGIFQLAGTASTGNCPDAITGGDFNSDGKPDFAVANVLDNTVSVFLGNGNGSFQAAVNYEVGTLPYAVITADFNKDGMPDLSVANNGSNDVSVLISALNPQKYAITGSVMTRAGRALSGITVNLTGSDVVRTITDGSGNYTFSNLANGDYTVFPELAAQTFTPPNTAITIANGNRSGVNFAVNPHTITAMAIGAGTISPLGTISVDYGETATFEINPKAGSFIADLVVDDVFSVEKTTVYKFSSVTTDHTIKAVFDVLPVRIAGAVPVYYATLQAAYDAVSDGAIIQARNLTIIQNVNTNRNIAVFLNGGYDLDTNARVGVTTLRGQITISAGTITIQDFVMAMSESDHSSPTTFVSPGTGAYNTTQLVTLACIDGGGSGCDKIYFTLDGSSPSQTSSIYATPITISTNSILRFFAVDKEGNQESVKTATYFLDKTKPNGSITINSGAATSSSQSVTLTLSCSDSESGCFQMQFSNDNSTWSTPEAYTASKAWTLALGDGMKTVYARFKDNAGNWSDIYSSNIFLNTGAQPDLTISALATVSTAGAGVAIPITDTTQNNGVGIAGASVTRFYLSINTTLDSSDTLLESRSVPVLWSGQTNSGSTSATIPTGTTTGTYYVIAKADGEGIISETTESNNAKSSTQIKIGPDLTIISLTAPASAKAGEAIVVTDIINNAGGGDSGASNTGYYLSSDTALSGSYTLLGSRSIGGLTAGGSNQGSVTVTVPVGTLSGNYYIVAKADSINAVTELDENNNINYSSISIQRAPDLTITSLSVPVTAGAGNSITVSDTTKNNGPGDADATTTSFYLSTKSSLDSTADFLGSRNVPALPTGATNSGNTTVAIPGTTPSGPYYIIAKTDDGNAVSELNDDNNTLFKGINIGPDLAVSTVTVPTASGAGSTITINDTTKNNGLGAAEASTTRFYLSTDTGLDSADTPLNGSRAVPSLSAGGTNSGTTSVTIPADTPTGNYYVIAMADGNEVITEINESNNIKFSGLIKIGPDLVVSALTVPSTAGAGTSITVTDTTKNSGAGEAGATTTSFYLSTDSTFDTNDTQIGSRSVGPIAGGATSQGTVSVTIPGTTPSGSYYIIARADDASVVPELNEDNNTYYKGINIGPDLAVLTVAVLPTATGAGMTVTITDTTKNNGPGAAPASTTKFYLSTDSSLDSADTLLSSSRAIPELSAAATSTGTTSVTIPTTTPTGTYYIIAKADGDDLIVEISETNNTKSSTTIKIGPDLTVSALTVPSTAGAGTSISVTDTTKNSGAGDAGPTTTSYYLSADTQLDTGDTLIGSRPVDSLVAGATNQGSSTVTIPPGTLAATYYIIASADANNQVPEISEVNNQIFRSIKINP